ncbi:MAG: SPFH domain-containing protein [Ignavibacteriales bacterium]|nr:SPFH domain-containing protein [Ignavibacteriales bacterium]
MDNSEVMPYILYGIGGLFVLIFLTKMFFMVKQQTTVVIERFGRFKKIAYPGLRMKIPFIDQIIARVNMRIRQLDVGVETKTDDDVFVMVQVSVQYFVIPEKVYDAFYKLNNPEGQITSYVFDVIRAEIPNIELDDVFREKDRVAQSVKESLSDVMKDYGYDIVKSLITDIDPAQVVKTAMNEKEAAKRIRQATLDKAEADKIRVVKNAEAEAESKKLQGEGLAQQRVAIAKGMKASVEELKSVTESSGNEVLIQLLITQYFDTLDSMAKHSSSNTIMLPHNPAGINSFFEEIRNTLIAAKLVETEHTKGKK